MLEMHDTAVLDILQPTPNHECAGEVPGKEDFVFDERCQLGAAVFEGLGRVVGVAILSGFQLDLFLSPVLWRLIARERVGLSWRWWTRDCASSVARCCAATWAVVVTVTNRKRVSTSSFRAYFGRCGRWAASC